MSPALETFLAKLDRGWAPAVSPTEHLAKLRQHIPALISVLLDTSPALEAEIGKALREARAADVQLMLERLVAAADVRYPGIGEHLGRVVAQEAELARRVADG